MWDFIMCIVLLPKKRLFIFLFIFFQRQRQRKKLERVKKDESTEQVN